MKKEESPGGTCYFLGEESRGPNFPQAVTQSDVRGRKNRLSLVKCIRGDTYEKAKSEIGLS